MRGKEEFQNNAFATVRRCSVLLAIWACAFGPMMAMPANASTSNQGFACEAGQPVEGVFYVTGRDVSFRIGPGPDFPHVEKKRAQDSAGDVEYRSLKIFDVLTAYCETGDWLQARIVESAGEPRDGEMGWVNKQYISDTPSDDQKAGIYFDIDGSSDFTEEEKELVRRGALRVLADESNCARVIFIFRDNSESDVYHVSCLARRDDGIVTVEFTPQDLASEKKIGVPDAYPEEQSFLACGREAAARVGLTPDLEFGRITGMDTHVFNNGNRRVSLLFTVEDHRGSEIPLLANCLVQPNGNFDFTLLDPQQ